MKTTKKFKSDEKVQQKALLLWPGIVIVLLQWLIRFGVPNLFPGDSTLMIGVFGGLIGGVIFFIWWAFFSRVKLIDRWVAILLIIVALFATSKLLDVSIATANMGLMFPIFSIPVMCMTLIIWAVATNRLSLVTKRVTMIFAILLTSGGWTLIRTNGMDAELHYDFAFRWAKSAEEKLLTRADNQQEKIAFDSTTMKTEAEWPGFRGRNRDGIIHGIQIKSNWEATPPVEMWHKSVGPGCSSFAVKGDMFFTQEQRGEDEAVTCYNLKNGKEVWKHGDKARFYDSHAGAGPRSTPTLAGDRVYTLGGTGILNALNIADGTKIWTRDAATENDVKVLGWGFTGSPLVIGDVVIISLSGKLAAYDKENGNPLWNCPDGGNSYSSPHHVTIDGINQVILMSKTGALSVEPSSGKQLWKYDWPIMDRILQPAVISGGDLLLANESSGVRRVKVTLNKGEWDAKEVWTSEEMKLNFNDICIHKGYAYGFDGPNIACVDLKDGKRMWKGAPYRGWLLLLADQDLLIVLTEKGDLALVEAKPDQFKELAKIPAIKGRTWNHPALAGNVLLVRNAEEMAAFRLQTKGK